MYALPHLRSLQSPPQTQTPQTLSDAGSDIGSPNQRTSSSQPGGGPSAVRRPGNGPGPTMQESPNARSKSVTVANGLETFGVCPVRLYPETSSCHLRLSTVIQPLHPMAVVVVRNPRPRHRKPRRRVPWCRHSASASQRTVTGSAEGRWRTLIALCTTLLASEVRATLPSSSQFAV